MHCRYTPMHVSKSQNHGQKNGIQPSYQSSDELLYNILYNLTVGHPKTTLEFVKNDTDSLTSDYKEIEAFSVAINKGIYCKFSWEERNKIVQFVPIKTTQPLVADGQKTVCTKCDKSVHAKCSLNFNLALCSIQLLQYID